jgi:hypothetical protein
MKLTGKKVKDYIEYWYDECKHCEDSLAYAANEVNDILGHDKPNDLLKLLIENKPIPKYHTHNYGFHTATGRKIINILEEKYNEHKD